MAASFGMHWGMAGGWWPSKEASYRSARSWLPQKSVRFDDLVDHLSERILFRPASKQLLKACCQATGLRPGTKITKSHDLVEWGMPRLLVTLLDSPAHMTR